MITTRIAAALLALVALTRPTTLFAQPARSAIVLPVELAGYWPKRSDWRREYTLALEDRLRTARFAVRSETFTQAESECHDAACVSGVGMAHGADIAVIARALNDEQRLTSYHLRVVVYEKGSTPPTREREKTCENCTETQARDMLATLMSATVANEPEATAPHNGESKHNGILKPPPIDPKQAENERHRRWIFRGLGIGFGAVGLLGLAQGIVEVAHNGDTVVQNGVTYRRDTTKGQGLFLGLGSAFLATGVALAVIGWWPATPAKQGASVSIMPDVSPGNARLVLQGTF